MTDTSITYKQAGVDTEAGRDFVRNIKSRVESTYDSRVLNGLGGFSALYDVSFLKDYKKPILLSGADGVGTKLELARLLDKHDTVGIDLVAMCANDILVSGGKPLFFLDYISCGKLDQAKMAAIVSGIITGCQQAQASLVGGETAEHPGVMAADEYDLAGFIVGVVEKEKMIQGDSIRPGDCIIGLASTGPHSNGFSLLRRLYLPQGKLPTATEEQEFIRQYLLQPTQIYTEIVHKSMETFAIKGMVHITGGGFFENIPRVLPAGCAAEVTVQSIEMPYVFEKIIRDHNIQQEEMYATFNMGVGYIMIVEEKQREAILAFLQKNGQPAYTIGQVIEKSSQSVILKE